MDAIADDDAQPTSEPLYGSIYIKLGHRDRNRPVRSRTHKRAGPLGLFSAPMACVRTGFLTNPVTHEGRQSEFRPPTALLETRAIALEGRAIFGFDDSEIIRNRSGGYILAFGLAEASHANFATPRTMHSFGPVIGHVNLRVLVAYGDQSITDVLLTFKNLDCRKPL
jgi:hypothetical protein